MDIVLLALATFRISSLLVKEDGPFGIFAKLRRAVGITVNEYGQREADTFLGELLNCVWCVSVWVGVGWAVSYYLAPTFTTWFALPLALSTVAIVISERLK